MKPTELMIGDWVYNTYNRQNERVQEICSGLVMLDYNDLYEYDEVQPIPLTTEILERNGLPSSGNHYYVYDSPDDAKLIKIEFKYVHELQHALRMCNIEKEIEL